MHRNETKTKYIEINISYIEINISDDDSASIIAASGKELEKVRIFYTWEAGS